MVDVTKLPVYPEEEGSESRIDLFVCDRCKTWRRPEGVEPIRVRLVAEMGQVHYAGICLCCMQALYGEDCERYLYRPEPKERPEEP